MENTQEETRIWRYYSADEPCETKAIECPDGITRLVRLPNFLWHQAYAAVNTGPWKSLQWKFDDCFERAKISAKSDDQLCSELELMIAYSIMQANDGLEDGPVNYRDLCER